MGAVDTVLARGTEKLPQPRVPGSERAGEVQRGWKGTGFAGVLPCPTPQAPEMGSVHTSLYSLLTATL